MNSFIGKPVSFSEKDMEGTSQVSGLSSVPRYLESLSLDLIGEIMHAATALLWVYPVSQADLTSSLSEIERARAGDLFQRYLRESAQHQGIQIH